ncbi:VCBS repeat-containing protein [Streptomyces sp. H10-C2]|uniref:FG-GAP repeat domain-containing protein n=1 Tax=unclassified Streptomyces TaxID=2593676 RepID=UPI0024B93ACD|nr:MULTISPECIES: VCBS repeat-containing protein [unclassified Streptomyces]MDJ0343366.1 VCBS repeat-containing protein [Streptomyces sp. PH10-H1]MDJ0371823.1 VCBS repeat-containing protein [Streptomyces sp. H10-C2]
MAQAFYGPLDRAFSDGWAAGGAPLGAGTEAGGTGKVRWADFDGDRAMDYLAVAGSGAVSVYLNRGGDGHGGWLLLGGIASGLTTNADQVSFADFTGDGNADYLLTEPGTNAATVYSWRGGDGHGGWNNLGRVASGVPIG